MSQRRATVGKSSKKGVIVSFWSWLFGGSAAPPAKPLEDKNAMNQGDYHSGPEGYSANTPYPETQYGSGFDEDAAWHEGEN